MTFAASALDMTTNHRDDFDRVSFDQGMTLADVERAVILETLKRQNFNRTRAARVLGIGIRTLQRKLKQYHGDHATRLTLANA